MERHSPVDKEAESKTFISPCMLFPITWDFKTAKQLQSQTSQHRNSSQNLSPVPFAQIHLPGMDTWHWPHLPLSCLWFTALASNKADRGSCVSKRLEWTTLTPPRAAYKQAYLNKQSWCQLFIICSIWNTCYCSRSTHKCWRVTPKEERKSLGYYFHTLFLSVYLTQYHNNNWVPPEYSWN